MTATAKAVGDSSVGEAQDKEIQDQTNTSPAPVAESSKVGPATLAELKAALPDSSAEFREGCLEDSLPLEIANQRWMNELRGQLKAQGAKLESAQAAAARPGVQAVGSTGTAGTAIASNPIDEWNQTVAGYLKQGMNRQTAMAKAVADHPELHEEYLSAYNEQHGRPGH